MALLLVGVAVGVMFDAWRDIYRVGSADEECSYVFLAPVVIGSLVWVRSSRLRDCPARRGWAGLLVLLAGWGVYGYGYLHDPVIWRTGAVIMAVGAAIAAIGLDASLRLAPAFAATVFLVPIDPNGRYRLAAPLQTITTEITQQLCDVLGMYVDRAGNLLSINGVDVTVAEACNGMRMILTLFMVCYAVAFSMPQRWYVRALVLAASPVVAIAANVVRLVPTVWMFGHRSAEAAEKFHDVSGWVMTVVAFLLLMGLSRLLQQATGSVPHRKARAGASAAAH